MFQMLVIFQFNFVIEEGCRIEAPCSPAKAGQGILYCKEFCYFNIRSLTPQPR